MTRENFFYTFSAGRRNSRSEGSSLRESRFPATSLCTLVAGNILLYVPGLSAVDIVAIDGAKIYCEQDVGIGSRQRAREESCICTCDTCLAHDEATHAACTSGSSGSTWSVYQQELSRPALYPGKSCE